MMVADIFDFFFFCFVGLEESPAATPGCDVACCPHGKSAHSLRFNMVKRKCNHLRDGIHFWLVTFPSLSHKRKLPGCRLVVQHFWPPELVV